MFELPGKEVDLLGPGRAADAAGAPWDRIAFVGPDPWVRDMGHGSPVPAREGAHVTYLLWSRQVDVESGKSFHANATRLETALAVQNESQWRLNIDPRFQRIDLHWLRVVRDGVPINHLRRDRMRLIQRETKLDRHVIDGSWTLLVVLDDVRPGDVIESGYTYTSRHPISDGWTETFFAVPAQFVVGLFSVSVRFDPTGPPILWRASADAPVRLDEALEAGWVRWTWSGSQTALREVEANVPSTSLDYIWVQFTDLPDWGRLADRVAAAWSAVGGQLELSEFPDFQRPATVDSQAVTLLIRRIQDEFRYLSIDLATGGWVPAPPASVARQRHGDCKDLVWLAASILGAWGVVARPVLVGSALRGEIANLLPMTLLLNHAVLEVEIGGCCRWFDMTLRCQGGDYSSQPVNWFGSGMPVEAGSRGLLLQPGSRGTSVYALRETIHLDTRRGGTSLVEVRLWLEGFQAENLRRLRLAQGTEGFAAERLKGALRRYPRAKRAGALQWRDDRVRNVCELAESFEVEDAVYAGEGGRRALYDVPVNSVVQFFPVPDDKPRRNPWFMTFPVQVRHRLTVVGPSMSGGLAWRRKWTGPGFTGSVEAVRSPGEWSRTAELTVTAPEIAADAVASHRQLLVDFFKATSWRLYLPWGHGIRRPRDSFGTLPPEDGRGAGPCVPPADLAAFEEAKPGGENTPDSHAPARKRWAALRPPGTMAQRIFIGWFVLILVSAMVRGCATAP